MQGRGRGNVAAERLCGVLFVGLTPLKGYFYINLGGTLIGRTDEADRITAVALNFEMKGKRFAFNGYQKSTLTP